MKNRPTHIVALVWTAVMAAVVASTVTLAAMGWTGGRQRWVTDGEYARIERYKRLDEVRETLMQDYYKPLEEDALVLGAIRGMTDAADDVYTFYYTPEELERTNQEEAGRYRGIGVLLGHGLDGEIEIMRVYPDTPAQQAGLRTGDLVVSVDGEPVGEGTELDYLETVDRMRGEAGTEVLLGIARDGERMEFSVPRSDVNVSYGHYEMLADGIGYVSLDHFSGDAADRFEEALDYFREQDAQGMVIDVRNNPGGFLTMVNRIADAVLPEGIIVYVQDRDGKRQDYYSDENCYDIPLAVLVNGQSASASEILAASVQALDRGVVVGLTTYGKGIVQSMITFPEDGAGMQYTSSSYYDANGRSIHGVGVTPDVEVPLEIDRVPLDPDPVSDNQLAAAIDAVKQQIEQE